MAAATDDVRSADDGPSGGRCSADHGQFHGVDHDRAMRHGQQDRLGHEVIVVIVQQRRAVA